MANSELASGIMSMLSFEQEAHGMEHGVWSMEHGEGKILDKNWPNSISRKSNSWKYSNLSKKNQVGGN